MGAGNVELGEVTLVRQQAHPVGILVFSPGVDRRVAVQHLDAPAEGVVALHHVAALFAPGVAALAAVVLGIFEVVLRGEIEAGVVIFDVEGLAVAVVVLLEIEELRVAVFPVPDVQIAARVLAPVLDIPVAAAVGLAEFLALQAEADDLRAALPCVDGLAVQHPEFIADAVFPGLDVVAVGRAAVLGRQLPLRRLHGDALAVFPAFGRGDDDIVIIFQIVRGRADAARLGHGHGSPAEDLQHHQGQEQQTDQSFLHPSFPP